MTHPPQKVGPKAAAPRTPAADPRYEIVFESGSRGQDALRNLVTELKSVAEWSGAAVGRGYARVTSLILKRVERFEDWNAERRVHQRANQHSRGRQRSSTKPLPKKSAPSAK